MKAIIGLTLLILVSSSQAGLVHRRFREVQLSESLPTALQKDQIPVTVIQLKENEPLPLKTEVKIEEETLSTELKAKEFEKKEVKETKTKEEQPVKETEVKEEKQNLLKSTLVEENLKEQQPEAVKETQVAEVAAVETQQAPKKVEIVETVAPVVVEEETVSAEGNTSEEKLKNQRQAATPPQNIAQQIFQNVPIIGPIITQLSGGNQQAAASAASVAADEPATTAATPQNPFQNPAAALSQAASQAQQTISQVAQNVFNSTSQAVQGIQQFASNIGTQVSNTITTTFGGQPQAAESSTPRPPGPIQSLFNNIVGGNNQQQSAQPTIAPGQQQGPFQGILNIFQGNRPQAAAAPAETAAAAAQEPANEPLKEPAKQGELNKPEVDDKIDVAENEIKEQAVNEVRQSEEVLDSFEEIKPDEIVVHDDVVEVAA